MSIRTGVSIPPCAPLTEVAAAARRAEELGFDSVWIPDAQLVWRDCFSALALAADRTSRIMLAPGITSTDTRHPTVVASAINTLRELAPGRVALGLGTAAGLGHLVNMSPTPRSKLRTDIELVRALLEGEWWDFDGRKARLLNAGGAVPVYLTAGGPKLRELAGALADGVILSVGTSSDVVATAIAELAPGLEAAGRRREQLDVVATAFFHLTDDLERDAALLKPICCLVAGDSTPEQLERAKIDARALERLPPIYPSIALAEDWEEAVRVASTAISDEAALLFAQTIGLFGTLDEIRQRVDEMTAAGVDHVLIRTVGAHSLPYEAMEAFSEAVIRR